MVVLLVRLSRAVQKAGEEGGVAEQEPTFW